MYINDMHGYNTHLWELYFFMHFAYKKFTLRFFFVHFPRARRVIFNRKIHLLKDPPGTVK